MLNIRNDFIDKNGNYYQVRNINFDEKKDLSNKLGTFITETQKEEFGFYSMFDNITDGVYIYQSYYDPKKALRIYKDWADYKYNYHNDVKLIVPLLSKQKNIKLTEFPTGIVTFKNYIIGQEIKFYDGYENLNLSLKKLKDVREIINCYQKIVDILKELELENIIYNDIHPKNFMMKDGIVKLIDFENDSIKLEYNSRMYSDMINLLKYMINNLNVMLNVDFKLENSSTLSEVGEEILIKSKHI